MDPAPARERPWARPASEVLAQLGVDPARGLSASEAGRRAHEHGRNILHAPRHESAWRILVRQFAGMVVGLLAVAAVVSLLLGHWLQAGAIVVVVALNAGIGFVTEWRAVRSMEALRRLGRTTVQVRRDGGARMIPAEDLVPGDIVVIEAGDVISADLRLTEASKLAADESTLTGDSVPVGKAAAPVAAESALAERACMLWKGTSITRGSATAVCVATGMATELGRIAKLTMEATDASTPLEQRLDSLARRLVWLTLAIAVVTAVAGILSGRDAGTMIATGVALAVAAIPEGLPIVATLALARGLWRLAKQDALVNRLSAVETLGATSIILTDKTGTLTENRMTVVRMCVDGAEVAVEGRGLELVGRFVSEGAAATEHAGLRAALEVGALCSNAALDQSEGEVRPVGDPMEVALLVAARKAGHRRIDLDRAFPERREVAFDPSTRTMATYHAVDAGYRVAVKGAAETVVTACDGVLRADGTTAPLDDAARARWLDRAEHLAARALRLLALAQKVTDDLQSEPYRDLTLLGIVGMIDPPRAEVGDALRQCRAAGLRVVMVTGDQAGTARGVARTLGLIEADEPVVEGRQLATMDHAALLAVPVFARVDPEQKLWLIELHQQAGGVVAMTGDGVNDAPALRKADIGVAMGRRGTQVAREAADIVLQDDSFASIVRAIQQGRTIFTNIRRFTVYLLSCNLSEVLLVFVASVVGGPLPLLPLQILYLNLVTDVFPALALGLGEGSAQAMARPPRDPREPILTRGLWTTIGAYGVVIAASVFGALLVARHMLGLSDRGAITVSFLALALAQVWHVFDMRDRGSHPLRNDVMRNRWVWGAIALCLLLLVAAVHGPLLPAVLGTEDPGLAGWALALGASFVPTLLGQIWLSWGAGARPLARTADAGRVPRDGPVPRVEPPR